MFIARARVADDIWNAENLAGYVHSSFDSAVNLMFAMPGGESRMFTLIRRGPPELPDCAVLSSPCFTAVSSLNAEAAVNKRQHQLMWGPAGFQTLSLVRMPSVPPRCKSGDRPAANLFTTRQMLLDFCRESQKPTGFSKISGRFRAYLHDFSLSLIHSDTEALAAGFGALVGTGMGLTPTCDDAMIGALGLAYASFSAGRLPGGKTEYFRLTWSMMQKILTGVQRTTRVSEKYMKCACRGQFSSHLGILAQAALTADGETFARAMGEISGIGHTSGMDTLIGFLSFLDCLISCRGMP